MIRNTALLLILLVTSNIYSQSFEGKVIYQNTYESKTPNVSNEQLNLLMGTLQEYVIKEGDYKSIFNGQFNQFQLYRSDKNKLYNKFSNAEALFWSDGAIDGEKVVDLNIIKNKETVLGINCDELTMKTTKGVYVYYYNAKYSINPEFYKGHLFGNWYFYVKESKAVPLKIIMDTPEFKSTSTAIKIEEYKVDSAYFELPKLPLKPISDLGG
tara:strand:- start:505 stop:1140 length:636 start_codon:yes stop_codon:yes gene_type:complete